MKPSAYYFSLLLILLMGCRGNDQAADKESPILVSDVDAQPLMANALRLSEALTFIGNSLPEDKRMALLELEEKPQDESTVQRIQEILDPFSLAMVHINPESRVKVLEGPAKAEMIQEGWTTYLIKVHNEAGINAKLHAESPNALPIYHQSTGAHKMKKENFISEGALDKQFLELAMYTERPMKARLSGLELEYFILQFYTKAKGKREVKLGFNVGQGSQDLGFRNTIDLLFNIKASTKVIFRLREKDYDPGMASFLITDGIDRYAGSEYLGMYPDNYRINKARSTHWIEGLEEKDAFELPQEKSLQGIYPLPARRVAAQDEYPDFFFQPQIYRADGEHVYLPAGEYHIRYQRGPEYLEKYKKIEVPEGIDSLEVNFDLERWIHMKELDWYSADHHIHASGCSHYESPMEGVKPEDMWRQVLGEDLNMGNNLTWGPSWYYQKQYFTASNHPLSTGDNILRYDVEVSGFPSSHAGHIVLLNLKEDDYPNTSTIEEWPSWTLPVLKWAKEQGGITGYAHSGWGLEPIVYTPEIFNHEIPKMDGIGANEYIVTVTHDAIDFYSAGDTPLSAELNMYYHSLNCGFKVRLSGETDFPCISDERVGRARIYAKLEEGLEFEDYMQALLKGRSYISDGYSHIIDFKVNEQELGVEDSQLDILAPQKLKISAKLAAFLTEEQDEIGAIIADMPPYRSPYWHIERARIDKSRKLAVELIVNGEAVAQQEVEADGSWKDIHFEYEVDQSSWMALRVLGSSHTNPIWVSLNGEAVKVRESAIWARNSVDQCWKMKKRKIRAEELDAAETAYDHARKFYDDLLKTAPEV